MENVSLVVDGGMEVCKNVIRFYAKDVYGVTKFYAIDMEGPIQLLTGQKTLTPRAFAGLEALGFRFEEVLNPERRK